MAEQITIRQADFQSHTAGLEVTGRFAQNRIFASLNFRHMFLSDVKHIFYF